MPHDFKHTLQPDWPAPPHIRAYTTTRQIPVHPSPHPNSQLQNLFQLKEPPIWINQAHGVIVVPALPENRHRIADASFTDQQGQVCAILTADCLPILICNQKGSVVAALHAGWRGLAAGIIEATLEALAQPPENLLAWLGPAIGPEKFEVGEEVYHAFNQSSVTATPGFIPNGEGKWLADLYALARLRLSRLGVSQIYGGNFCTYTQAALFFSYRRDHGKTGRMASLIWIEENSK